MRFPQRKLKLCLPHKERELLFLVYGGPMQRMMWLFSELRCSVAKLVS